MLMALAGVSVWLGFFTARHIPYQSELWWQFTMEGDASRFLRAMVGAGCIFAIIAVAQILRPAVKRTQAVAEPEAVRLLVELSSHSDAALAFLGDKDFTFSDDGRCGPACVNVPAITAPGAIATNDSPGATAPGASVVANNPSAHNDPNRCDHRGDCDDSDDLTSSSMSTGASPLPAA